MMLFLIIAFTVVDGTIMLGWGDMSGWQIWSGMSYQVKWEVLNNWLFKYVFG